MNFEVESLPLFEVSHPFFKQAIALFSQQLLRTYFHVILDVAFIVPIELFLVRRFIGFVVSPYYMTPEPLVYLRGLGRIAMISTDRALARQFTTLFDFANQLRIHPYPRKATFIGTTFVVWSIAYLFLLCCPDWIFMLSWIYWRWPPTDKPKTHALRIDGKDLGISETIFNALEVLMPIYGTAYIWIDAVCIIKKV